MLTTELRRAEFLSALFEMSGGNPQQSVETALLGKKINMEEPEISQVAHYLKEEGLIEYSSFSYTNITHKGLKVVEATMAESYLQKKRRVLEMIADISRMSRIVIYDDLAKKLGMTDNELAPLCNGLDEDGSIDFPGGDIIQMKDAGYRALEPQEPLIGQHIHIHQPQNSPMSFGPNSRQTVNYNNQPIQEILPALTELIEDVRALDFSTRDDVITELEKVQSLAKGEMNAGVWQLIQSRLLTTKTALEVASLAASSLPHWPMVWDYFFK